MIYISQNQTSKMINMFYYFYTNYCYLTPDLESIYAHDFLKNGVPFLFPF